VPLSDIREDGRFIIFRSMTHLNFAIWHKLHDVAARLADHHAGAGTVYSVYLVGRNDVF
jgi:hypothetical protein